MKARYLTVGDRAVTIEFGRDISPEANSHVRGMDLALQNSPIEGTLDILPTIRSLLVYYDPERLTVDELKTRLEEREKQLTKITLPPKKLVKIPCCYGGEYGPDLEYIASVNGLRPSEVIQIHSNTRFQVYCFGTAPGSPNMGITPPEIATPRRPTPRTSVPPGTVAIGGKQCVFYIVRIPGGHWALGRTPLKLFYPAEPLRRLVELGDSVQFYAIDEREFKEIESQQSESDKKLHIQTVVSQRGVLTFKVINSGLLTTVQDLGRYGYLKYGVPFTGAMDEPSLRMANILVGNGEGEAGLEITLLGPKMQVMNDTVVAAVGANCSLKVNGQSMEKWIASPVSSGDILSFGPLHSGCRAYLSVAGGIDVPKVLNSSSTFLRGGFGGMQGRPLSAGDILFTKERASSPSRSMAIEKMKSFSHYTEHHPIRVIIGPQDDYFTKEGIEVFLNSTYIVSSQSDRSGCRLEGPRIVHSGPVDIISEGVPHGSIQVLPNGDPLIFFKDRQIGGYPKIAVVITVDQNRLAQLRPMDAIRFEAVSIQEAHRLYKQFKKDIGLKGIFGPEKR